MTLGSRGKARRAGSALQGRGRLGGTKVEEEWHFYSIYHYWRAFQRVIGQISFFSHCACRGM